MASPHGDFSGDASGRVRALFDRIAPRYDTINDVQSFWLHRTWKRRLVRMALDGSGAPGRALDVCCGTGDIALALAQAGAATTGLDFSAPMLQAARQRAATLAPVHAPQFVQGDALNLPFADASFDVVTCAYGLRNLTDLEGGLAQMRRVLTPGGRLLILDFGKPANTAWRAAYFAYLRFAVPVLGWLFCGDAAAYAYILESLRRYPAQEGVAATLRALGFVDVVVENLLGGVMSIHSARAPAH